jgi:hypothetical protein
MPHGHQAGWAPHEIDLFIEHHLRNKPPLPILDLKVEVSKDGSTARVKHECKEIKSAQFHWTNETGEWQKRNWQSQDAIRGTNELSIDLPAAPPLVGFFTLTDSRDATVSTEHFSLE